MISISISKNEKISVSAEQTAKLSGKSQLITVEKLKDKKK